MKIFIITLWLEPDAPRAFFLPEVYADEMTAQARMVELNSDAHEWENYCLDESELK